LRDDEIAVVIHTIALLFSTWEHLVVEVVAISAAHIKAIAIHVGIGELIDLIVAVVVDSVTQLRSAQVDRTVGLITVPCALAHRIPVYVPLILRDEEVAVIVKAVAQLWRPRERFGARVITVAITNWHTVAVLIELSICQQAVTVVVETVAELKRSRVHGIERIVTVAKTLGPSVLVEVELVVRNHPITVIVDSVANLFGAREPVRVLIVAILTTAVHRHSAVVVKVAEIDHFKRHRKGEVHNGLSRLYIAPTAARLVAVVLERHVDHRLVQSLLCVQWHISKGHHEVHHITGR
jgi:hypothetical protein